MDYWVDELVGSGWRGDFDRMPWRLDRKADAANVRCPQASSSRGGELGILAYVGDFMKFCTGWYPHHDVQRVYRDGRAPAVPDFQEQLKQLADLRDAGVASEDELFAEKVRTLSRT